MTRLGSSDGCQCGYGTEKDVTICTNYHDTQLISFSTLIEYE